MNKICEKLINKLKNVDNIVALLKNVIFIKKHHL